MRPNALEVHFCQWVLQVAMSDMRVSEKLVTIVAPLLQTGDVRTLMNACNLSERAVKASKARPVKDGWLQVKIQGGGRGIGNVYIPSIPGVSIPVLVTGLEQVQVKTVVTAINARGETSEVKIAAEINAEKGARDSTLSREKGAQPDTLSVSMGAQGVTLSTSKGASDGTLSREKGAQDSTDLQKSPHTPLKDNIYNSPLEESQRTTTTWSESDEKSPPSDQRKSYPEAFEAFWKAYPDKTNNSKVKAHAEWVKLDVGDRNAAKQALPMFVGFLRDNPDHPCLHAERYLKYRRFDGFLESAEAEQALAWWQDPARLAKITPERWREGIKKHANGIWPLEFLGPPPGTPECVVPQALLNELRLTEIYTDGGIKR